MTRKKGSRGHRQHNHKRVAHKEQAQADPTSTLSTLKPSWTQSGMSLLAIALVIGLCMGFVAALLYTDAVTAIACCSPPAMFIAVLYMVNPAAFSGFQVMRTSLSRMLNRFKCVNIINQPCSSTGSNQPRVPTHPNASTPTKQPPKKKAAARKVKAEGRKHLGKQESMVDNIEPSTGGATIKSVPGNSEPSPKGSTTVTTTFSSGTSTPPDITNATPPEKAIHVSLNRSDSVKSADTIEPHQATPETTSASPPANPSTVSDKTSSKIAHSDSAGLAPAEPQMSHHNSKAAKRKVKKTTARSVKPVVPAPTGTAKPAMASTGNKGDGAGSYMAILEAFLCKVALLDRLEKQDALCDICKLYTVANMAAITAYELYPHDATATKGFALLYEVLTNKQGMTLEQQMLVCAKPYVRGSIELFLRALVADQFVKQKQTLLPLVTAELPNTAKGMAMLDVVKQYVIPLDAIITVPAAVTKNGFNILSELLHVNNRFV